MTKRHFFNGYVTLSFFVFTGFYFYLWISFISSQCKYICENICIFHNGKNTWFLYISLYILLYSLKALVKIVPFFTTFQKYPLDSQILPPIFTIFMRNFSLFMRFFAFHAKRGKKLIKKNSKKGLTITAVGVYL